MTSDHLLGKYRGFGLFYDEDDDVFFSDLQDRYQLKKEPVRTSLKNLKKVIDDMIKDNLNFEPFEALRASIGWGEYDKKKRIAHDVPTTVKILAIKKDGGLMVKSNDRESSQINGDDRYELFVKDAASEAVLAEIAILEADIDLLIKKKEKLYKKFKPLDLQFIDDFTNKKTI